MYLHPSRSPRNAPSFPYASLVRTGPHTCDLRGDIVCKTIKINGIAAQLQELCRRLRFKPEIARFTLHVLEYRQAILDRPGAHIVNIVVEPAMIGRRTEAVAVARTMQSGLQSTALFKPQSGVANLDRLRSDRKRTRLKSSHSCAARMTY